MEYRQLGSQGPRVSALGFGCWAIGGHGYGEVDDATSTTAIQKALELGVNLFDTADVYGFGRSEQVLSAALGDARHDVVIATKFGVAWDEAGNIWKDSSPARAVTALEASLRRLRVERIPLYQVHWSDGRTPLEETLAALERQRDAGKIEFIGLSNFASSQFTAAGNALVASCQYEYNVVQRSHASDIKSCQKAGIGILVYGVLARGLLSGKFDPHHKFGPGDTRARDPNFSGQRLTLMVRAAEILRAAADRAEATPAEVAIRWAIDQPGVTAAIVGAKTAAQVAENVGALNAAVGLEDARTLDDLALSLDGLHQPSARESNSDPGDNGDPAL